MDRLGYFSWGGGALQFLPSYLKVARTEYLKGELPAVLIPALLTLTAFGDLASVNVVESILVFSLLYVTGFMINSLTDREIDLKYSTFKRSVGEAAGNLGERKILALIAVQLGVGLLLALDLAVRLHNLYLVPLVLIGVFFGLAYSARPFSFKTRGLWAHALSLSISAFAVPFLFLYIAARGSLDFQGLVLIGSFSVTAYSLEYANQAYDFTEDLAAGVATPAVRLGLRRSLRLAFAMCAVSLPLLAFSLASLALSRPAVPIALGEAGRWALALGAVGAVGAGYFLPLRGLARIAREARMATSDSQELVATVHRECNYSLWQASGVTGVASFALVLFLVTSSTTGALTAAATGAFAFDGAPTASVYRVPGGYAADVDGLVLSDGNWQGVPEHALVRAELFAPGERVPYATFAVGILLPAQGAGATFAFAGLPLRGPPPTTLEISLIVDSHLRGVPDTPVRSVSVELRPA